MKSSNTITLNLSKMEFTHPLTREKFLTTLETSPFKWIKEMVARVNQNEGEEQILTMDLNDPPFAKDISFMENAEKLMETLAEAADAEVRKSVVHSIYANCKALNILLNDEKESIREIAKKRLSGLTNDV